MPDTLAHPATPTVNLTAVKPLYFALAERHVEPAKSAAAAAWLALQLDRADREWLAKAPEMLKGNKEGMPAVGKYNAGQKLVFWAFAVSLLLLLVTGFMFWSPWFVHFFPITLRRIAVVVHAASAFVLVISVMTHIYAAIWIKGTMRAMTRGTVTEGWARLNHPLWHRKMTRGE